MNQKIITQIQHNILMLEEKSPAVADLAKGQLALLVQTKASDSDLVAFNLDVIAARAAFF